MFSHPSPRLSSPPAAGTRPPPSPVAPRLRLLAWLLLLASGALIWFEAPLLAWAERQLQAPLPPLGTYPFPAELLPNRLLAQALVPLFSAPVRDHMIQVLLAGLALLAAELTLRALLAAMRTWNERRAGTITLRVRAAPLRTGEARTALAEVDLLRAIHALLPAAPVAALVGRAPWLTLLLRARSGEPVELLMRVAGGTPVQQEALAQALQAAIVGHAPGALVERVAAPTPSVLPIPTRLAWRQFRMAGALDLPLRTPDDSDQDPLALLASALRPTAAMSTELHLALRPQRSWALTESWRAAGLRRLLRLQQKADHALGADAKRLESRLALPAFAAELRVLVVAREPRARAVTDAALRQIGDALASYAERTGGARQAIVPAGGGQLRLAGQHEPRALRRLLARQAPTPGLPGLLLPRWPARPPLLLTVAELVGFWHLPTRATADVIRTTSCRHVAAPRQAFVPLVAPAPPDRESWLALGAAAMPDGVPREVGLMLSDLRYVLHLTAGMGAGKSRLLANLCQQLTTTGYCLLDGKGDDVGGLNAFVLGLIPLRDEHRVTILDPRDARWPVGLNPLAGVDLDQPGAVDLVVANTFALFARIDPETWGGAQGMRDFLDKALRLVLAADPHPTLANVKQALLDGDYRTALLERCRNRDVAEYWQTVFPRLAESQRASRDALLRRFDKLLSADLLRLMITRPDPALSFGAAIEQRSIMIVPIPNVSLGDLAGVYAMLVFQQFLRAAFARPGDDQSRVDYPLVIDELQVLIAEAANDDIETALSRLRSLAVPLVIAHQALSQLGAVEPLVQINAENRIILKTREPDASAYARQYGHHGLTAADIANQDPHEHQYAVLRCGGQPAGPFSMEPLPWPTLLDEALPPYDGPAWQTVLPPDSSAPELDQRVAQFAYEEVSSDELNRRAQQLAFLPEEHFAAMLERWEAIRQAQLRCIATHPGCIPAKLERMRWRSRLRYGMPYLFAEAIYRRARPALAPEPGGAEPRRGASARGGAKATSAEALPPEPPPFSQADQRSPARSPGPTGATFPEDDDAQ